jgi:hypothetical protein
MRTVTGWAELLREGAYIDRERGEACGDFWRPRRKEGPARWVQAYARCRSSGPKERIEVLGTRSGSRGCSSRPNGAVPTRRKPHHWRWLIDVRARPWSRRSPRALARLELERTSRPSHRRAHRHLPLLCARALRRVRRRAAHRCGRRGAECTDDFRRWSRRSPRVFSLAVPRSSTPSVAPGARVAARSDGRREPSGARCPSHLRWLVGDSRFPNGLSTIPSTARAVGTDEISALDWETP